MDEFFKWLVEFLSSNPWTLTFIFGLVVGYILGKR